MVPHDVDDLPGDVERSVGGNCGVWVVLTLSRVGGSAPRG